MELIKIEEHSFEHETKKAVSARDLHSFLEVGKDFSTWIKSRIRKYGFKRDSDYLFIVPKTGENSSRGRPEIEYYISLDMAKELAMVEKNDKGREVRKYFIECERELNSGPVTTVDALYAAVGRLVENERKLKLVKAENESDGFTSLQTSTIDALIHAKYKYYNDGKVAGLIKRDLKKNYFEITSTRTYKEIPRKHFDEVCSFIQKWERK